MTGLTITKQDRGDAGEYQAHLADSEHIGRLTWVERDGVHVADHTLVPPEIGGRGVAARLVEALIADARENDFKVKPLCSYVVAAFKKHPEWDDVKA
ncbi:GNAT family N-acetyltransferase [Novosphingobium sp. PC22D]|uniref:GNAT family N-acetyltransferase n=1 Tax=Novosphingobium sp. PC22D TaxID=1962403 RepID=UPI000BEFB13D|nr:GNAT family N-acetyltransferase [Novosphingobium sp. PC22D]PEQ12317.1 GNAT family N-acetyltransferase [Novosphingobium sp. PC22D]